MRIRPPSVRPSVALGAAAAVVASALAGCGSDLAGAAPDGVTEERPDSRIHASTAWITPRIVRSLGPK